MTPDGYRTVFDITEVGYKSWSFPAFGLIFVFIGLLLPFLNRRGFIRKSPPWMEKWFPRIYLGFSISWTLGAFLSTYVDYRQAIGAMRDNSAKIVEGPVTKFHPMPYSGHADESFDIQGVKFSFSDYDVRAGFNNTASHGGPIREGLRVRIWYLDGEILRLDVRDGPEQPLRVGSPNE
jgi:hypothetical protein